jgi:Spy/CpxP family protein refolding chaperone
VNPRITPRPPFAALLLVGLVLALPFAAHADDKDDWLKGKLFPPDVVLRHQSALKLTETQRQAIRREIVAVQSKVAPIDFDLMDAAVAFQEQLERPQLDRAAVLEKADAVLAADARKKRAWLEMLVNVRAVLTPEQVATLQRATGEGG